MMLSTHELSGKPGQAPLVQLHLERVDPALDGQEEHRERRDRVKPAGPGKRGLYFGAVFPHLADIHAGGAMRLASPRNVLGEMALGLSI